MPLIFDSHARRGLGSRVMLVAIVAWLIALVGPAPTSRAAPPSEPSTTNDGPGDGAPAGDGDPVAGSPAGDGDASPEPASSDERSILAASVSERARRIVALIDGTLDPQISTTELFTIELGDPAFAGAGGAELRTLLTTIHATRAAVEARARALAEAEANDKPGKRKPAAAPEPEPLPEPKSAGPEADALERAQAQLARALWQFAILPGAERQALLDTHAARHRMLASNREAEARARARLERLRQHAARLAALIDGTLDVSIDPAGLLRLDLSDPNELVAESRLARALGLEPAVGVEAITPTPDGEPRPAVVEPWSPDPELAKQLAAAEAALDAQRLRFLALDAEQRAAVLAKHAARQHAAVEAVAAEPEIEPTEDIVAQAEVELTEAEEKAAAARRDREKSEAEAAAHERSEAVRRISDERIRLKRVNEANANYEVELKKREKDAIDAHEIALRWDRDVDELAARTANDARAQAADAMYGDLRMALGEARDRLRDTLTGIARDASGVEPVGEPIDGLPSEGELGDLQTLREEVAAAEQALRELESEVVWRAADLGRDDIVLLNAARLTLLDLASDELHARMTGFGIDGIAQVERELDQIGLELRYRLLALPRIGRRLFGEFESRPLPVVFAALQLVFGIVLFRYWRRRAEPLLRQWRAGLQEREQGGSRLAAVFGTMLWYVERIRRPLEWLLLFAVLFRVVLDQSSSEIEVVWLVILWLLLGSTVILLVDAIAAHENMVYGRGSTGTAKLRIRSLRLVGLTIVWTGLTLSLTEELVGMGAIHKWVRSLVWLAAIPIVLMLIHWWREPAFRRIENDPELPDSALVRWIRVHDEGWTSFAAAALAGAYLFTRGIARWLLRRATALEMTRRMLAWMFRREVLRQASARREDETPVHPLDPADYARFDPIVDQDLETMSPAMAAIGRELIDAIVELGRRHQGTLSAVIGERGSGKSTLLRRIELELQAHADELALASAAREAAEAEAEAAGAGEAGDAGVLASVGVATPAGPPTRLTICRLQCPPGGIRPLQRALAASLGLDRNATLDQLRAGLAERSPVVFLLDDAHRLVRPAIGGLDGLDRLADFARSVRGDASWVLSIGAAAWQYVSRARGERVFFDQVLDLPRWNERAIGELVRERSVVAGLQPNFDEIVIPRQFDVATVGDEANGERPDQRQRAELGFYRILWDYAKGNPAVALHFWRESLWVAEPPTGDAAQDKPTEAAAQDKRLVVRLFAEPNAADLDAVGPTMHFVLRAVVQLEVASVEDLVACTQLPPADVADACRYAVARGWVDRVGSRGERYRVTWHWYRAITDMLRRQHLLAI